ncbi:polysaccharide biosynthesis protein [Alkalispirochaeta alkalica]|uniref:polysaccharide biosynthesis protein n=1 Tax=Alkalispirochaeta alkalica TaxID=46356 RepID=UPI00035C82C3|nr:polysaccharide biosynthesis protein [Alkalispirochaeta alkalica]
MFDDRTLLITGGTGSFGNAVLRRFLESDLKEIRIFSRDEKKQDDMRHLYKNDKIKFYIGDVRNPESLMEAMRGVDYVFSAAALKQVPSCEFYPLEAVQTNVVGTGNTLDAAIARGVKKVVVLSTDKAVYPINAMGMSKALMEKVTVAKSRNVDPAHTTMCSTRYGNVMASRGSVIPLFISQIKQGQPITVTDPEMTRFMMSLDEAVDLVLFAFENAEQGDTFVKKAPAATIGDLAEVIRDIFGAKIEIKVIGTRHGEKLYETLLSREEAAVARDMGDFYRVPADSRDLNYGKYFEIGDTELSKTEEFHSHNTYRLSKLELRELLLSLDYVQYELKEWSKFL